MKKPANTQHPIHDSLTHRWSPRAFSERMVEEEKILSILEAARWAPSSFNEQPWSFILSTKYNQTEHESLLNCLMEGNRHWAKYVPVLMISVAKMIFDRNNRPNRHAFHDVGLAVGNLVIQASHLGLHVHQMAGIHADKARETYKIPDTHEPVAVIAIGYYGEIDRLPEELRERELAERVRKSLKEFVFSGSWNKPFSLITEVSDYEK
ncbi:nitroreductase family protein [Desulfobacterota bacterium AH_259_B03_O07]|nr:nitroreductase family protein [Desulfobacterota bacterium AH_259_B03_O07]